MARRLLLFIAALAALTQLLGCTGMGTTRASAIPTLQLSSSTIPLYRGMTQIAPHVFVERDMQNGNTSQLLNIIQKARVRIAYFYGDLISQPDTLLCSTMECYHKFGGVGLGYTLGNRVIISPQGMRAAIVSHELSHVELAARLGGRQEVIDRIPQWFNEGTAVMVSLAYEFSDEAWLKASDNGENAPKLNELVSRHGWNEVTGINGSHMQDSYGTARQEVARWFAKVGREGLNNLISALNAGEDFNLAYHRIEKLSTAILATKN